MVLLKPISCLKLHFVNELKTLNVLPLNTNIHFHLLTKNHLKYPLKSFSFPPVSSITKTRRCTLLNAKVPMGGHNRNTLLFEKENWWVPAPTVNFKSKCWHIRIFSKQTFNCGPQLYSPCLCENSCYSLMNFVLQISVGIRRNVV